ncbi:hypothetical protein ACUY2X_12815 [Corynebacterium minutissimum]
MKFSQQTNSLGQFSFSWERTEYDAFPPAEFFTADHAPRSVNPDRRAVALALLFAPWVGDEMYFPGRIGPHTAHEIREFTHLTTTYVGPIEYYPKGLPIGFAKGLVSNEMTGKVDFNSRVLFDLPSHEFNGALRSLKALAVGTNSFMFKRHEMDVFPTIAVAVLFAEDMGLDEIVIDTTMDEPTLSAVQQLLSAVRLGFSVTGK